MASETIGGMSPTYSHEQWERLGRAVDARIEELGLTQKEAAQRWGVTPTTLRSITYGRRKRGNSKMPGLDDALEWERGSCRTILQGGDPRPIRRDEAPVAPPPARLVLEFPNAGSVPERDLAWLQARLQAMGEDLLRGLRDR